MAIFCQKLPQILTKVLQFVDNILFYGKLYLSKFQQCKNARYGEKMKNEVLLFLQQKQKKQFNKKLYNLHNALRLTLKFCCAIILYAVANVVVSGVFKMLNVNVVSLFYNCLSTVNATYPNVVIATSLCMYCLRMAVCFAMFLSMVWLLLSFFVSKVLTLGTRYFHNGKYKYFLQRQGVNVATFSYKHHVAFLA